MGRHEYLNAVAGQAEDRERHGPCESGIQVGLRLVPEDSISAGFMLGATFSFAACARSYGPL